MSSGQLHKWVQMDGLATQYHDGGSDGSGTLGEFEQEELARLRREKATLVKQHADEKAAWEKERAELEDEREVLSARWSWGKEAMGR
ncbi:hypothetical protein [Nonomuraea aurantiaca]|uniref:hypothetical protein n=1 Tax=Nonomuraea aurantiaca TaxID=2878562 RepID=UPI001CDA419D|nr:hypothetical protein [Nonomuraea aurantiaca]MCA2229978.1 hypothetical protein [Nonomuraea aurantiaca]